MKPVTAFAELSNLVLSEQSLTAVLQRVADLAKTVVPDVREVSVTLMKNKRHPKTVAATGSLAHQLDEQQYEAGFGPCMDAAVFGRTIPVSNADADADSPYPEFSRVSLRSGVSHSLSVGMPVPRRIVVSLNMYASGERAFDTEAVELAQTFAGYAALAIANTAFHRSSTAGFFVTGSATEDAREADLQTSVTALLQLAASRLGLQELLTEVAVLAVQAIPKASGASLTLAEPERANMVVATADFVHKINDIQYRLRQAPCLTAMQEGQTVVSWSLGADARWPRFGGGVARLGVHSAVSIPLRTSEGVIGALSVYANVRDAFTHAAVRLGELFAVSAAIVVQNGHALEQSRRRVSELEHAVQSRAIIERAVGIMMSRTGGTPEEALTGLVRLSQNKHHKLIALANTIVEEASARARARHHP